MSARYRPLEWPRDREPLSRLDVSLDTAVIYRVSAAGLGFTLIEEPVDPPLRKRYDVAWDELPRATAAVVAEWDGAPVGVGAIAYRAWNRSAVITDLYVDRAARGRGVGAGLLRQLQSRAEELGARCLWLETQNVNAPAVRFYLRQGFTCCGLDTALYDPRLVPDESALFFTLPLDR